MKSWIRLSVFFVFLAGIMLAPFAEAEAALNAYLKLEGQTQGSIKGSVTKKGQEGKIAVTSVNHALVSPRDAASGLPTGKRMHKPFVIIKEIDKSSPLLHAVLVNNENLPKWSLEFYQPGSKGAETLVYSIKLVNASVASIRLFTGDDGGVYEEVTFTYQKIEWLWNDGKIIAMDDWEVSVAKSKSK